MKIRTAASLAVLSLSMLASASKPDDPIVAHWEGTMSSIATQWTDGVPDQSDAATNPMYATFLPNKSGDFLGCPGRWKRSGSEYSLDCSRGMTLLAQGQSLDPHAKGKLKLSHVMRGSQVELSGDVVQALKYRAGGHKVKAKLLGTFTAAKV